MIEPFTMGFSLVAGIVSALALVGSILWTADTIAQFFKRYRQAWHPAKGIHAKTRRERLKFAIYATINYPRI